MAAVIPERDETLDSIKDVTILQKKNGYRFSSDAILLFSFVGIPRCNLIADLGAGSGIISMLLAKKYPESKVFAVELQKSLSGLARRNAVINNFENRVIIVTEDINKLPGSPHLPHSKGFDLVVSNPPFRKRRTGLISPEEERAIARHEISITLEDLIKAGSMLLKTKGRFDLVYHPARLIELFLKMKKYNLEPKRLRFVHSNEGREAKMALIEGVKEGGSGLKVEKPLYIYDDKGEYTDEMKEIYGI